MNAPRMNAPVHDPEPGCVSDGACKLIDHSHRARRLKSASEPLKGMQPVCKRNAGDRRIGRVACYSYGKATPRSGPHVLRGRPGSAAASHWLSIGLTRSSSVSSTR